MEVNLSRAIDFFYPSSSSLELVYFEAIANAIDAGANNIQISIAVDSYSKPESRNDPKIDAYTPLPF